MNSVTRWNPFREFDDLFANLSALNGVERRNGRSEWMPPVDITETAGEYQIKMDVPAIDIKDINVEVKDGLLTVSGERQETIESDDDVTRHRVERRYGSFSRGFRLPEDVDGEAISATVKDGVLTLTLTKREVHAPRRIEVKPH